MKIGGFMANRLLLYGYDTVLLDTRCSIVAVAGLGECTILRPRTYRDVLGKTDEAYSAVVICHTVPAEERSAIGALAAEYKKPVLQIERFMAPQEFVSAVSRLMSGGVAA